MSVVNQRIGSYLLIRKLCADQDDKIYQAALNPTYSLTSLVSVIQKKV